MYLDLVSSTYLLPTTTTTSGSAGYKVDLYLNQNRNRYLSLLASKIEIPFVKGFYIFWWPRYIPDLVFDDHQELLLVLCLGTFIACPCCTTLHFREILGENLVVGLCGAQVTELPNCLAWSGFWPGLWPKPSAWTAGICTIPIEVVLNKTFKLLLLLISFSSFPHQHWAMSLTSHLHSPLWHTLSESRTCIFHPSVLLLKFYKYFRRKDRVRR